LLLLTDDGRLQHEISHPDRKEAKTYLVQVDGVPDAASLARLQAPLSGKVKSRSNPVASSCVTALQR